jgi:signal transduction histidine kinase
MENVKPQQSSDDLRQLAHDLRNAMSAIYSYAQFLEQSLEGSGLEKEAKIASDIVNGIRKMESIISERLDW